MTRKLSGLQGWVGRAASLALTFIAVLTLVASGASHDLLHADEPASAAEASAATPVQVAAAVQAKADLPVKTTPHRNIAAHGCSGHCGAHAAHQAPTPVLVSAPMDAHDDWRVEAAASLRQRPVAGPERPPRA